MNEESLARRRTEIRVTRVRDFCLGSRTLLSMEECYDSSWRVTLLTDVQQTGGAMIYHTARCACRPKEKRIEKHAVTRVHPCTRPRNEANEANTQHAKRLKD